MVFANIGVEVLPIAGQLRILFNFRAAIPLKLSTTFALSTRSFDRIVRLEFTSLFLSRHLAAVARLPTRILGRIVIDSIFLCEAAVAFEAIDGQGE